MTMERLKLRPLRELGKCSLGAGLQKRSNTTGRRFPPSLHSEWHNNKLQQRQQQHSLGHKSPSAQFARWSVSWWLSMAALLLLVAGFHQTRTQIIVRIVIIDCTRRVQQPSGRAIAIAIAVAG